MVPDQTLTPGDYEIGPSEGTLGSQNLKRSVANLPVMRICEATDGAPDADLQVGELLGKGGMGTVHLARQASLDRDVAVKRLTSEDPKMVAALLREAALAGTLEHPNIVPVHALGQDESGKPVLVMKRIEGARWSTQLKADTTARPTASLDHHLAVLADVCNAVHYAHSKGIVHRDIKPDNVLIGEFGEVVLVDWGVAARFVDPPPGVAFGTPGYMAPEMAYGEQVDARTDVFLLGATLHKVLTGKSRNFGPTGMASILAAAKAEPYRYDDDVPEELGKICNRACSKRPVDRFPTAQSFRDALVDFRKHRLSLQFSLKAGLRFDEMRRLAGASDPDPRALVDLGESCCYAFEQALDEWGGNSIARGQLLSCLELLIPFQLRIEAWGKASSNLDKLRELTGNEYTQLGERVDEERRHVLALHKLGKELDLSVGSGWRIAFLLAFAVTAMAYGTVIVGVVRMGFVDDGHALSLFASATSLTGCAVVLAAFRKSLLHTLANQRIMYTLLAAFAAVFLHRVTSWQLDIDVAQVYPVDLLLLTLASCVAGIAVDLRILWLASALVVATVVAVLLPHLSLEVLSISIASTGVLMALLFLRWVR